jgi:pyruvate dehydrogenase E1 component alpha subunit
MGSGKLVGRATSGETALVLATVPEDWERIYRALERGRRFDDVALKLQRQGVIDSYGEARGQEGGQIGLTMDLRDGDMVFPSYRQPAVALERGVTIAELLRQYSGVKFCPWDWRKTGYFAYTIPVGTQVAHATGWAWGERRRGTGSVTVVYFGDGAASQGEVHEAMNYAGVFDAPLVFVLENNGWAISLPARRQTRASELHLRAAGYGFPGVRIDGNDVLAARQAAREAFARARAGEGPTLIELITYRMGGHTTSDDPTRYRDEAELVEWAASDPLVRFRAQLEEVEGSLERMVELDAEIETEIDAAVDAYLAERGV